MDRAAAVDEECRRISGARALRIDGNRAGVLDIDLRACTDGRNACRADVRRSPDGEIPAIQIDIQRNQRIGVRDRRADLAQPAPSLDDILAARDGRILREDVLPIRLANAGVYIGSVMYLPARDARRKICIRLLARRLNQRCIEIFSPARRLIKRDIFEPLSHRSARQTFGNLHTPCEG